MKTPEFTSIRNVFVGVDMQNDFITGSLAVDNAEQIINPINELASAIRASLGRVAFTRDWHPEQTPHFDKWPVHCVANTWGAEFTPKLNVNPTDYILSKGMGQTDGYSGMSGVTSNGTTLENIIQPKPTEKVQTFIGGLATDYCVRATAIGASIRFGTIPNVEIYAIRDAMRAVNINPQDEAIAIAEIASVGVKIITLEQALDLINQTRLES